MTPVPQIVLAVSTLDRVAGVTLLLQALEHQDLAPLPDGALRLVVVDNGPHASARGACAAHAGRSRFALTYLHEPRRGLSFARNAALDHALETGATHIAFIDDDEMPDPQWLGRLHARLRDTGAAAAMGPVLPLFEAPPPAWAVAGGFFAKALAERHGLLADGYTSNALVDLAPVRAHAIRFDLRCNHTGGEDTLFFRTLLRCGGQIVLASTAIVHEVIPPQRATRSWLLRRWFRTGVTEASLRDGSPDGPWARVHDFGRGLARVAAGLGRVAMALPTAWARPERLVLACYTPCRGVGLIASALGRSYGEYAPANYRAP